eukprot:scaffold138848_cov18-Tisochrysis_lutea.AAC.1
MFARMPRWPGLFAQTIGRVTWGMAHDRANTCLKGVFGRNQEAGKHANTSRSSDASSSACDVDACPTGVKTFGRRRNSL